MRRGKIDPLDALERAQDKAFDAWEADTPRLRTALAREALAISPLCADAYVILAQDQPPGSLEALTLWEQAFVAGTAAVRAYGYEDDVGDFWGLLETRPYMRARLGLAQALWATGRREEAAEHLTQMLRLNPDDNQGVRYQLLGWLVEIDRPTDVDALLRRYKDEWSVFWLFTKALVAFRKAGAGGRSDKLLAEALAYNPHVAPFLLGRKRLPKSDPPYYSPGEANEAVFYAKDFRAGWSGTPGALDWLRAIVA